MHFSETLMHFAREGLNTHPLCKDAANLSLCAQLREYLPLSFIFCGLARP